jgi:hypothetical protein
MVGLNMDNTVFRLSIKKNILISLDEIFFVHANIYILAVKYNIQTVMFSYFNNKNEPIFF